MQCANTGRQARLRLNATLAENWKKNFRTAWIHCFLCLALIPLFFAWRRNYSGRSFCGRGEVQFVKDPPEPNYARSLEAHRGCAASIVPWESTRTVGTGYSQVVRGTSRLVESNAHREPARHNRKSRIGVSVGHEEFNRGSANQAL